MIGFKQYLNEIFDKPLSWKIEYNERNYVAYLFKQNDTLFEVGIRYFEWNNGDEHEIYFGSSDSGSLPKFTRKTPFQIYATLIDIVRDYSKKYKLKKGDRFTFSADHIKTLNIYEKFAHGLAKLINGTVEIQGKHFKVIKK